MRNEVTILGAGESGIGAATLAKKMGYSVFVSDSGKIGADYKKILIENSIKFEEEGHSKTEIFKSDLVVKSPGIPDTITLIRELNTRNIEVISEIEFAGRHTSAKKICVTGSNGKTTTTMLIHHILTNAGIDTGLVGNVGKSFARQVAVDPKDIYIIELSSFQLDGIIDFSPDIALLLNITPDHLDRYEYSMQKYTDSKFKITQNQNDDDLFIYCSDDPVIHNETERRGLPQMSIPFTLGLPPVPGAGVKDDLLIINYKQKQFSMSILDLSLQGKHNIYNSMAAGIVGMVFQIRNEQLRESLSGFHGIEHRLERFLKVHGIEFINDSKATNVNSTWYALESIRDPIVWLAGGIDKGNDYDLLKPLVKEKVKAIVCIGKDNSKLHQAFAPLVKDIVDASDMEEAVKAAYYLARNGDAVLLSPACASFDRFDNYEDRGNRFKEQVRNL